MIARRPIPMRPRLAVLATAVVCASAPATDAASIEWWRAWEDESLASWIATGLDQHPSMESAAAIVARTRAARAAAASAGRPSVMMDAAARLGRRSDMLTDFETDTIQPVELSASMAWEADLFGRIAARVRSADARIEAADADRRGIELSLAAEIAAVYFDLTRIADALPRAGRMAAVARDRAAWSLRRAEAGLLPRFEADAARVDADDMERALAAFHRDRDEAADRATALLGPSARPAPAALADFVLPDLPNANGGERVVMRPDVVRIFAQSAALDAAAIAERKERLPTVALLARAAAEGGRGGTDRTEWSSWIGPRLSLPIGDPRLRPAREMADAERDATAAEARAVVRDAVREIDAALARRRQAETDLALAERQAATHQGVAASIRRRAEAGLVLSGEVMTSELRALAAEDAAAAARATAHDAHLNLLRALGG